MNFPKVITDIITISKKQQDMVEPAASSVYALMASWFTPSCLFIVINLVIGTIVITSRFATSRVQQHQLDSPQLVRSPSLLHRVMSFNLGYNKYEPPPTTTTTTTLAETETKTQCVDEEPVIQNHDPTRLEPVPSLGLNKTESQEIPCPTPDYQTGMKLTRAPSLLERVMSVKFYRSKSMEAEKNEPESDIGGNESGRGYLEGGEEEGVDEKAGDFIKRFKQQLRLQRLDSVLRYRDMFKRN